MMFRVKHEVHRKAVLAAELAGKSLNQWAVVVLGMAAGLRGGEKLLIYGHAVCRKLLLKQSLKHFMKRRQVRPTIGI